MRADYDSIHTVRLSRRWGWVLTVVLVGGVVLALAWHLLEMGEQRAQAATLENLQSGLVQLAAQRVAQGQRLEPDWLTANPFHLLRWESRGYCGEVQALAQADNGCWYFWPTQAWVVRREQGQLRAWRLRSVPEGEAISIELVQVMQSEIRVNLN